VIADLGDGERQVAIVEQDLIARLHVVRQLLVRGRDAALVADHVDVRRDRELATGLELDLACTELAHADLRALEIEQHGDRLAAPLRLGADDLQQLGVIFVTTV